MTISDTTAATSPDLVEVRPPRRFRAGEARGARIGRPLRIVGRVREVDEDLMADLGRGYRRVDEPAAALAAALRSRGPDRVTHAQLRVALAGGSAGAGGSVPDVPDVSDVPAVLTDFLAAARATPPWVDWDLVEEGARVCRSFGRNAGDVLLQLSLIGGYRFGGPTDLLVATGGLTGDSTIRRLAETQFWTISVTEPGAMRPGGAGWRLTLHVRVMHALVNHTFGEDGRWDEEQWGRPVNQTDQAATLGLFSGTLLLGVRALGVPVSRADSHAVMHLWRYVGWLMGVDERWLFATEREQHAFGYHVLLSQGGLTQAGRDLTHSIVDAQPHLHFRRHAWFRRRFARRRLLSMLRPFLGARSMRELDLPLRLPWATLLAIADNVVRYRVVGRTAWGRRRIEAWSARYRDEQLHRYFGADAPDVGALRARSGASGCDVNHVGSATTPESGRVGRHEGPRHGMMGTPEWVLTTFVRANPLLDPSSIVERGRVGVEMGWTMLRKVLSVALMSVFVLAGSAAHAVDDEYPDPTVQIAIDVDVCNGEPIRFSGQASVSGDWTVTLDGVTRTGSGDTFTTTFPVDAVNGASAPAAAGSADAVQALAPLTSGTVAALAPGESGTLTATLDYGTGTVSRTATVAVPVCGDGTDSIGDADADGGLLGILPGTGGLALWIVVLAAVLLVAGATITRIARRRA